MVNADGRRAMWRGRRLASLEWRLQVQAILVAVVVVGCKYRELPRLEGQDAEADGSAMADGPVVDGPPQFTSCMGVATTCGPGANESCCRAEVVPGGMYYRSYDGVGYNDMGNPATVSGFVLDVYEVTVGRFRAFVNTGLGTQGRPPAAGAGAHPQLAGSGWDAGWNGNLVASTAALVSAVKCSAMYQTWTDSAGVNENKAMNCVTWYEAMAFCIWDGGYLPTEAEWNYAASGGDAQRAYSWSNPPGATTIDCTYANYRIDNPAGTYCVNGTMGAVNQVGSESPKGDGRWKHADLAGNVWEWTLDWYAGSYPTPCDDCANTTPASYRVVCGGSFFDIATYLRAGFRGNFPPTNRSYSLGFRCARTPQ